MAYKSSNSRHYGKIMARYEIMYILSKIYKADDKFTFYSMPGEFYTKSKSTYVENQILKYYKKASIVGFEWDNNKANDIRLVAPKRMKIVSGNINHVATDMVDAIWADYCGYASDEVIKFMSSLAKSNAQFVAITIGGRALVKGLTLHQQVRNVQYCFKDTNWEMRALICYQNGRSPMRVLIFTRN